MLERIRAARDHTLVPASAGSMLNFEVGDSEVGGDMDWTVACGFGRVFSCAQRAKHCDR